MASTPWSWPVTLCSSFSWSVVVRRESILIVVVCALTPPVSVAARVLCRQRRAPCVYVLLSSKNSSYLFLQRPATPYQPPAQKRCVVSSMEGQTGGAKRAWAPTTLGSMKTSEFLISTQSRVGSELFLTEPLDLRDKSSKLESVLISLSSNLYASLRLWLCDQLTSNLLD